MIYKDLFHLLSQHWPVSFTMAFGSFVAGATAEGGGAVAFPVFTKVLHIPSDTARDFSLAIQSVGMTCGSILIVRSGYKFLESVYWWSVIGASLAVIFGLEWLAPLIVPPYPKIFFSLFTVTFGGFLIWLNSNHRQIRQDLSCEPWTKKAEFFFVGLIGGLVASIVGSGADVVLFVVLCLRYDMDEKIATRTTVFLMASVSMVSFSYLMLSGKLSPEVLPMWLCAAPIVAFGAPLGAVFCSWQKRESVVAFLIALIFLEFITTLWLVPFDFRAKMLSAGLVGFSTILMFFLRGAKEKFPNN